MIKTIDHIIIHTPTAEETLKEMENTFGIKAYVPLIDYGFFKSAMIRFGNIDIEILELGEKQGFEPYLYGIAFEPMDGVWKTIDALEEKHISHSLPSKTTIKNSGVFLSWSTIVLENLLDNAMNIPSGTGAMYANNWLGRSMAKLTDKLMCIQSIRKAASKNIGDAMVFFCAYDPYPLKEREMATQALNGINGGIYSIKKVQSIVIKIDPENKMWDQLGNIQDDASASLGFVDSNRNEISHIVLKSSKQYDRKEITIGNVRFEIE